MKQNFENDQKIIVVKYAKTSMNSLKVKKVSGPKDFL
jgi:hypothetical protein